MINKEFKSIIELLETFPDEQTCIAHLEQIRWNRGIISPYDHDSKVYKCSDNRYRCKNTSKYFNVKTRTLFENTKIKLRKWFLAVWLVTSHKKGISSVQLGRDINVTQKTAWFMLQRIRNCFGIEDDTDLSGRVEVDETYIGGKNRFRHKKKKAKRSQGRSLVDKVPVFGMLERGGKLIAKIVINTKGKTLLKEITAKVNNAMIYTDEWIGYQSLYLLYPHKIVRHNNGEYVRGDAHTNTIEGFWSLLKRGITGIYHFTSRKHLQYYIDEFVFRYNSRMFSEAERFNILLKNLENRLTYKELTA